ncbi:FAD-binding oxidoreductase [Naumannella halotolerans]|uniref:FAD-binding oxidoreductase n=1 Tax=Naumannella halotolerans TaxID=993414 RepID=UPI00370D0892
MTNRSEGAAVNTSPGTAEAVAELCAALPQVVSTDPAVRAAASHDRSHHESAPPLAVITPTDTEQVSTALRICHRHRLPVVTRGSATGLEGGSNAFDGSVVLDLRAMDRIVAIHAADFDAVVQPGVMKSSLNAALDPHGLFFPGGPGVDASMGGMISTRASGTNAVRYGTMREQVLALTAVLADGRIIHTGTRARKSAAGYDLTHLLVGAEGTLAVITEATVKVYGKPDATAAMICSLDSISDATAVVQQALTREVPLARVELIDDITMGAINAWTGSEFVVAPTVIFEVTGSRLAVQENVELLGDLARSVGATGIRIATDPTEVAEIWSARAQVLPSTAALVPGARTWSTDVCVPISRLAECIALTQADVAETGILAPIVGHVGDGNFHLAIVLPPDDPEARERAGLVNERLIDRALSMGGTCTGEHGIGVGKVAALAREHHDALPVMQLIKDALDPRHILNPGVILTDPTTDRR